jgi:hypothetical protein
MRILRQAGIFSLHGFAVILEIGRDSGNCRQISLKSKWGKNSGVGNGSGASEAPFESLLKVLSRKEPGLRKARPAAPDTVPAAAPPPRPSKTASTARAGETLSNQWV